ncbi:DUF5067 domain-containing protein [Vagococcus silagei]|uniref:DUF5067 domain-containing protein n=1 Tax=Vagococcus silagei TaxID=2508885 RepID=A0A4S3B131_9ENTE|nr:DUF5067 domain-containing protein [Vagococcus silagei]THB60472.1 DUF5067 domain-containing protein [Vagococcus silagei]
MKKVKLILISSIALLALAGCNSKKETTVESKVKKDDKATKESTTTSAIEDEKDVFVKNAKDASFDGKILRGNTYSVRITDHKIIQPGEPGNDNGEKTVVAFWYDTLVAPDYDNSKPINPTIAWMFNFEVVQDNDPNAVNKLKETTTPDEKFRDTMSSEIKLGGTVANELTDDKRPVKLTAKSLLGDEFGSAEFKVK